ncbi:hypothetical protein EJ05DRAFT_369196 [Pseudovirgaria hyperparasitica]|uniref:Uncharacterized protein n=1 Tax=Pseudovirgaria hyperparasitica TaxID=470096 RepID=A0A6A6W764_9PEZI|nr:uncharacterized protein EJ05DRAFT_369196 [Pseudovirgaria hyperparasitica]KAF2757864.1 hypothetical protein EJ05DRAFT_369196 [Pseudovirgaria hyperparasitica]
MPPIPIHLHDPINPEVSSTEASTTAGKASGITPQTAPPPTRTIEIPTPTTTSNTYSPAPPAAPQPASRYIPAATTALTTLSSQQNADTPPPPQPGAVPIPPQSANVVEKVVAVTETRSLPPQASLPPPTDSQLSGKSTIPYQPAQYQGSGSGSTSLPLGTAKLSSQPRQPWQSPIEHPPGYVQNYRAFEDPPELREAARRESELGGDTTTQESIMNALNTAGESLKKGEEAIWKWVEGKK